MPDAATAVDAEVGSDDAGAEPSPDAGADDPAPIRDLVVRARLVGLGASTQTVGIPGVIYPYDALVRGDTLYLVGEARSELSWSGTLVPPGGFVLAIDVATGALRWARAVGEAVDSLAELGGDLVVAGAFDRTVELAPTTGAGPLTLRARGAPGRIGTPTDGLVVRLTTEGTFVWARRFGGDSYDHAFDVDVAPDGTVWVVGQVASRFDVGDGCAIDVATFPGDVDPEEGFPRGTRDAVLAQLAPDGACLGAAVLGAPLADDAAYGVAADPVGVWVSGQHIGALELRTDDGRERMLGGPVRTRPMPFAVRLDATLSVDRALLLDGTGGGSAIDATDDRVAWAFTSDLDEAPLLEGDRTLAIAARGVSVARDGRLHALGPDTMSTRSMTAHRDGLVLFASAFDRPGVAGYVGWVSDAGVARHAVRGTVAHPLVVTSAGGRLFATGYGGNGLMVRLGDPELVVDPGANGGIFVVELTLPSLDGEGSELAPH